MIISRLAEITPRSIKVWSLWDDRSEFKAAHSCCAEAEHYLASKINKSWNMFNRRTMEDRGGRKCKPGYCGVRVWYSKRVHKVHPWPRPCLCERSGLRTKILSPTLKNNAPSLLHPSVRGFRHAGSPGSCCSRWRSSPAAWRPTARCWSPLQRCRPGWDPQWPVASVGCPRSEPGGRQLRREDIKSDVSSWKSSECS